MVSMMPTIAASTGQSFIPEAIRAELPLTMSTVSPTPASTVSTATSGLPSPFPRGSTGLTTSSLLLVSRGSLRVATTVPTIFPTSTALLGLDRGRLADRERIFEVGVGARDDVDRHE